MAEESLIVLLDAKTAKLDAKLKSTNDKLDKLDKSTKKADNSFVSLGKAGKIAGAGIVKLAAAGVAATAALTAATVAAIGFSKELKVASNRSGESVEKLQSMAFASKTVGVSLEKLGDIGKDTSEKIGEFIATGGGGFQDFADVIGLTKSRAKDMALEFQELSGPQVLQEMVRQMEAAGVSSKRMSFALEGMASDTTDLIPLLVDGGAEMKRLEGEFDALGVTLTKLDLEKIDKLAEKTAGLAASTAAASSKTVAVLADEIGLIAEMLTGSAKDVGGIVIKAVTGYQILVQSATAGILNLFREGELLALQAKSDIVGIFGDNTELEAEIAKLTESDALRDSFDATFLADKWEEARLKLQDYYGELNNNKDSDSNKLPEGLEGVKGEEEFDGLARQEERNLLKLEQEQAFMEALAEIKFTGQETEEEALNKEVELHKAMLDAKLINLDEFNAAQESSVKKYKKAKGEEVKVSKDASDTEKDLMRDSMALAQVAFGENKAISATLAFINTAEGVTNALAKGNYASAAVIAATGAIQISNILSASPGTTGTPTGASKPVEQQENFVPDSTSLAITDSTASGSTQGRISFSDDSGDDILDAIARGLNKGQSEGRFA